MKLQEFLDNPAGKGDSSMNRTILIQAMNVKYNKYIEEKSNKIKVRMFREPMVDNYYIHLELPTETDRGNTYDVVLYFIEPEEKLPPGVSLLKTHEVQFFCNAPSFPYTYAYVYNKHGLLIPALKNRFSSEFYSRPPEIRNSHEIINSDKYLYFGCKYVYENHMLNRAFISMRTMPFTPQSLASVRTLDKIMTEYKKAEHNRKRKREDEFRKNVDFLRNRGKIQSIGNSAKSAFNTITKRSETVNRISKTTGGSKRGKRNST